MIIYQIKNKINDKRYIGQTIHSLKKRWREHCQSKSFCRAVNSAIQKYGKENFTIEVIDKGESISDLNNKESFWIGFFNTMAPNGYNLTTGGENYNRHEDTKRKIGEANKGHLVSEETKAKISKGNKGKTVSNEARTKISESNKRRRNTEEFKKKMSKLPKRKGYKHSEETKKRISEANKGKKRTEETKKKMSESGKGKIVSEETRKKMSKSGKGRVFSEEHKKRMKDSAKIRWDKIHKSQKLLFNID